MSASLQSEIVYSSNLTIDDREVLSSLAVFYDRVVLPATTCESAPNFIEFEKLSNGILRLTASFLAPLDIATPQGDLQLGRDEVERWESANASLFTDGVLVRLAEPDQASDHLRDWLLGDHPKELRFADLLHYRQALFVVPRSERPLIYIKQDHLRHLLRTDVNLPSVFVGSTTSRREILKAAAARETFKYLIPGVGSLTPDEILVARAKVSDTREGFSMHLQKLSANIEAGLEGGESLSDIQARARAVIETDLIPDFREFRRQLLSQRGGFWLKVLEASRKVFEIEVPPWTPAFYARLLAALGVSILTSAEARRESLSNRSQAFQFMAEIQHLRDR